MFYSINFKGNTKTQIPTTTSSKETCPNSCPLKDGGGCYAESHWINLFWNKLSNGLVKNSGDFSWLLMQIKSLRKGQLWRMNQAGDLPHENGIIIQSMLHRLTMANKNKKGFTYTHHLPTDYNAEYIKSANDSGFTVNLSANNLAQADEYLKLNIGPVVTLLPIDADKVTFTPAGNKVVVCPAENNDKINCGTCGLCYLVDRDYIIGFRAHGGGKKRVEIIAKQNNLINLLEVA